MKTLRLPSTLLAALAATAAAPAAQHTLSGSENRVGVALVQAIATGSLSSNSYGADAVAWSGALGTARSSFHFMVAGVAGTPQALDSDAPLVFAVSPTVADKTGGSPVTVRGFALDDGSGTALVAVGGTASPSVSVIGKTSLTAVLPAGTNGFGNPLGPSAVEVGHSGGTGARPEALTYTPSVEQHCPAHVGELFGLRLRQPAGNAYLLFVGFSIPGVSVPMPPVEGALELLQNLDYLSPAGLSSGDDVRLLKVPGNPNLAGVDVEFQAASLSSLSPLSGSFTNRVVVSILP